ncbi:MAG TPA: alpha/beta hydrolase, partial [Gemmatimonadaceae bacterium]|nr:alpha/beta hydrolase [Gemmatimonadaceae bacterium]
STTTYPFRVFNFNELDEVVRSVPLRPGYRAIVPLYSEGDNALETDSVDVEGTDSSGVWNVRFADKVIIGHYGIDGATRRIVRYEVNRHADKAHFCYLFGSDSTRTCPARRAAGQARVSRSNAELPRWLTLPEAPPMPRPDTSEIVAASGGARLYAAIFHRGGASPVLLLHGGLENSDVWSSEVARLSPSHEVIVIDTRGHGRSTLGDIPLSYALFAEDAIAVLDSLHIPSVVVVGTSDGGITGLRLAIDDPQRIDGLLTYGANFDSTGNPSAPPDSAMDALGRLYVGHAKTDYERVSPTPGNFPKLEIALGKLYAREPAISHAALRSIRAPTTIVDGDHEQFVTRAHTGQLAALIPGAHLVVMPGVSHDGPVQDPDGFHRIVTQFLAAARHGSHASVRQEFEGAVGCAAR